MIKLPVKKLKVRGICNQMKEREQDNENYEETEW